MDSEGKQRTSIFKFIDNYFFYHIPREEKKIIRKRIVDDDHKVYRRILYVVIFLQLFMLIRSFVTKGFDYTNQPWNAWYCSFYGGLAVCSVIEILLTEVFASKGRDFAYFTVESVSMVLLQFWSVGITVLDSHEAIDLTTFAYVTTLLPIFISIEPWIMAGNLFSGTVLINVVLYINCSQASNYGSRVLIHTISIFVFAVIGGTFNFYRRIKRLKLALDNEKLTESLSKKAEKDELTGLFNRRYLTEHLNTPLNTGKKPSGVMMFDIDYFKSINDTYGHVSGDIVLMEVGKAILNFIGDEGYAVRYGGEEFLIFYEHTTKEELFEKAEKMRDIMGNCIVTGEDGSKINFTVSLGTAIAKTSLSYSGIISLADSALYKAKENRNCTVSAN